MIMLRRSICALILLILAMPMIAQDSHYWTNQYGTESWLLGGAVVGSRADLASTFYNPASLAYYPDTTALQTAISFNWSRTGIEAKDLNLELRSGSSAPLPTLVSVNLPIKFLGSRSLQLSFLKRTNVRMNLNGIAYSPVGADTNYVVSGSIIRELFDSWFGITWSRSFGKEHAVGITGYFSAVASTYSSVLTTGTSGDSILGASSNTDYQTYDNIRFLAKAGYFYEARPISLGLAITTPSLKLFNTFGEVRSSQTTVVNDSVITLYGNKQTGLDAEYRTPLSIAFGATWYAPKTTVFVTVEWFDGLEAYTPLQPEPFTGTIPATTVIYGTTVKRYGIANVGVAARQMMSETTSMYVSLIRDGSSLKAEDDADDAIVNYDLYHATLGWQFTIDKTVVTAGGIVGGGFVDDASSSSLDQFVGLISGVKINRYFLRIGALIGIVARF